MYADYTPIKAPLDHILEVGDKAGIFMKLPRSGPPGKRDEGRYCAFHDANGQEIADYRHLRDHIEDLIRRGYLIEFVAHEEKKYKDDKVKTDAEKPTPERTTRARSTNTIIEGPYYGGTSRNSTNNYVREARGWHLNNLYI